MSKKDKDFEEKEKKKDEKSVPEAENSSEEVLLLSKAEVDELKANLENAKQKEQENLESWQRERADFINYKKRMDREQAQNGLNFKAELLKKYLVILDDMELAIRNRPQNGDESGAWIEGIELISRKVRSIIESEGLEKIDCDGAEFNPNLHQAISYEENPDFESGQIIEVIQNGYRLGERVIRPALVRVAQ
ncbi:MAG: nucleotide exchange factor GrpE [Flexilinea sp.]|jgi:molecular chaperone GrpE